MVRMSLRTRRILILSTLLVIAAAAIVIAIATSGGDSSSKTPTVATATAAPGQPSPLETLFAGIPQKGFALGSAPATLEEFIDPQCPFCGQLERNALATLVSKYVRPGRVKLVMRPLAFLGDDSVTAARMFAAAALQNKAWQYADVFYANQGEENSGYVTTPFLTQIGQQIKGFDTNKALADRNTKQADRLLAAAAKRADQVYGDNLSTPSLLLTKPGAKPQKIELSALTAKALSDALDAAL